MGCVREERRDSALEVASGGKYHAERPPGQAAKKGYYRSRVWRTVPSPYLRSSSPALWWIWRPPISADNTSRAGRRAAPTSLASARL